MPTIRPSKALPATPWQAARAGDDYGATATPDWRDVNWRPHLGQIEIDGRSVNYVDYGSGSAGDGLEPVVFVHGLGGCWQNWLENIPRAAAEGRRAIALDLPGFGFSEMPGDDISISGYGRVVNSLCDELDLGEVVLVGNSMGGFISAETAIQFPARVARVVLVSAAGVTTSDLRARPIMAGARVVAAVATRTATMSERVVRRRHLRHLVYHSFIRHPTRIRNELLYEITRGSGRPGFLDALQAIMDYDFRDRLPEIGCPTLIVWGTEDMLVPSSDADEFERLIPRSRKVIFRDTGHMAMLERPQTFNDCMMEFLAEESSPAASEAEVEAAGGGSR
jgi:pimeloyl-ACP methyl ester carboxylesterase